MTPEYGVPETELHKEPTAEEKQELQTILSKLEKYADRPWFGSFVSNIVLGPTRALQEGVRKLTGSENPERDDKTH